MGQSGGFLEFINRNKKKVGDLLHLASLAAPMLGYHKKIGKIIDKACKLIRGGNSLDMTKIQNALQNNTDITLKIDKNMPDAHNI